jgi:hypothetical protein
MGVELAGFILPRTSLAACGGIARSSSVPGVSRSMKQFMFLDNPCESLMTFN